MTIRPTEKGQLREIIGDALELHPSVRGDFISSLGLAPDTAAKAEELLANYSRIDGFLTVDAADYVPDLFAEEDLTGKVIGPYKIVSPIGRGGMGRVYKADRIDGKFDQTVAVKFLRTGFSSSGLMPAFDREVRIQSRLNHPSIASVYDTGVLNAVPYVVMEYVEGVPIDDYCDSKALSLSSRLKLFNKVCDAVAFAHQNLVIHRDIKPANVLVTNDGQVKLLDFGIAALEGMSNERPLRAYTPGYSSPASSVDDNSTAVDIYSLGAVLRRLIGDEVPNDLASIAAKAAAEDPEERYRTAESLAADIWRFIDGFPVGSYDGALGYRLSKLWARKKLLVSAASLIAISLALGAVISAWQANVARAESSAANDARSAAESNLSKAEEEKRRSEKISKFMFRVLSYANPQWYALGHRTAGKATVYDVIVEMGESIDKEFAAEPDVAAEIHHRFAEVFLNKREPAAAELSSKHIARAYELRRSFHGERNALVAKDMLYMYYNGISDGRPQHEFLADAVSILRETAPNDIHLAYMIEVIVAYLVVPGNEPISAAFIASKVGPQSGEEVWDWAERISLEADSIFKANYTERNAAIVNNDCRIALIRKKQGLHDPNSAYVQACRELIITSRRAANSRTLYLGRPPQ